MVSALGLDHLRFGARAAPMSLLLDSYRKNAETARIEAEQSSLPNVRARAAEVANRWNEMAAGPRQVRIRHTVRGQAMSGDQRNSIAT